jgi:hypothetical protein
VEDKYIHGFTPLGRQLPGSGPRLCLMFVGCNIANQAFPTTAGQRRSSARYVPLAPRPRSSPPPTRALRRPRRWCIRDQSTGARTRPRTIPPSSTTPASWVKPIADYYIGGSRSPIPPFPNVDVYAEKGLGIETLSTRPARSLRRPAGNEQPRNSSTVTGHQPGGPHQRGRAPCGPPWRASTSTLMPTTTGLTHFRAPPANADVLARLVAQRPPCAAVGLQAEVEAGC